MTLLLTLALDEAATAYFQERRTRHYPAQLDRVPAHVMLFHRLPLERTAAIADELQAAASERAQFEIGVREPRSIGRGVSYDLDSADLVRLRSSLAAKWHRDLIAQDREPYRPHVVVQNKVDARTARTTLATLSAEFEPFTARAAGLVLWTYRDGYWEEPRTFSFAARSA